MGDRGCLSRGIDRAGTHQLRKASKHPLHDELLQKRIAELKSRIPAGGLRESWTEWTPTWGLGFRFPEQANGKSPVGATIKVHYANHTAVQQIVTGDGYRSQRSNCIHFGLGTADRLEKAEITWADRQTESIHNTVINASNEIKMPKGKSLGH